MWLLNDENVNQIKLFSHSSTNNYCLAQRLNFHWPSWRIRVSTNSNIYVSMGTSGCIVWGYDNALTGSTELTVAASGATSEYYVYPQLHQRHCHGVS